MTDLSQITPELYERVDKAVTAYCARHGIEDRDEVLGIAHDSMVKACATYKSTRGTRLSTWVMFIFQQELSARGVRGADTLVPLAEKKAEMWNAIVRMRNELSQALLRAPTPAELAEELDIPIQEYFSLRDLCEGSDYVELSGDYDDDYESGPTYDDWDAEETADVAFAVESISPEELAMALERDAHVRQAISRLPPLEHLVILARYGHSESHPPSQAALAEQLGVDQQRVSDAETSAIKRLTLYVTG